MSNKLYLLTQDKNEGYDVCNAVVVCAPDEESARNIHPQEDQNEREHWSEIPHHESYPTYDVFIQRIWEDEYAGWVTDPKDVRVQYLGIADDSIPVGVVVASYNSD